MHFQTTVIIKHLETNTDVCVFLALQHCPEDVDKRAADMYSFAVIPWEIVFGIFQ